LNINIAPEIIEGSSYAQSGTVDWWAVGIMMYEFLTGAPPFNANSREEVFDNILHKEVPMEWTKVFFFFFTYLCSMRVMKLLMNVEIFYCVSLKKVLKKEFDYYFFFILINVKIGTLAVDEIKKHPFFASVNWDTLYSTEAPIKPQIDNEVQTKNFDQRNTRFLCFK
jgi:serine/threonine-protein kinase RIM15